jgi:carboxylate-amine ligase
MADDFREPKFGSSTPFSIGVEEELFLVRARDGGQIDAREEVLGALESPARGEITGEVFACQIELITDICKTSAEAIAVLSDLRRSVLATGIGLIGSATHPVADEDDCAISETDRYHYIADHLGDALSTPVAALHVHVGMPDAETAIRVFNGLRRHLPVLEALGANSPFRHGRDSGFASARELGIRAWPRSGAPREMVDYADFSTFAARLTRAADVPDYTFHWWKLRPHPRLGTVEIRALDVQTAPSHTAALVALVQALALYEANAAPVPGPEPAILEEASYRAGREGTRAELPDSDGNPRPFEEVLAETVALVAPAAAQLECEHDLEGIDGLVRQGGGAGAQRADYEAEGMSGVLAQLLKRSRP